MIKKNILIFVFTCISHLCFSQSDLDKNQQLIYTYLFSNELVKAKDLIYSDCLASKDDSRKVIGYVYLSYYYSKIKDKRKRAEALNEAKILAGKTGNPLDGAYVNFGYAGYFMDLNDDELFLNFFNKSFDTFSKSPDGYFMLTLLYFLKQMYNGSFSDYSKTRDYALKTKNPVLISWALSRLGNSYLEEFHHTENKKNIDSAILNYNKSYQYAKLIKEPAAREKSFMVYYINYSYTLNIATPAQYEKAMKLNNLGEALIDHNPKLWKYRTDVYNNKGFTYEGMKDYKKAEEYYLKAYKYYDPNNYYKVTDKIEVFENLSNIYQKLNDYKKALFFEKEIKNIIKEDSKRKLSGNVGIMKSFYNVEQKNQQITELRKRQLLYIVIILLIIVAGVSLYYTFNNKYELNIKNIALLEAEQKILMIQQERLKKHALAISLRLDYKNNFIKGLKSKMTDKTEISMDKIWKEDLLNENDFNEIQNIVEKVHPDFFKSLASKSTAKLSNLDMKYAAYIYMNMDNQQIANILKADPNTVRVAKYRLKQKMGLSKNDDLRSFIQNMDL
ncbi:tetratricopeptide repeat protein [Chryseobacterium shigense]|uniref:tetratricopeptide repeat protein n=1 Tax=Chryseobacterium shigense TaxID=297244 RepID=UPI00293BC524|nr:tetratricopeptide repeat protein [Chryseobacterium shigense]